MGSLWPGSVSPVRLHNNDGHSLSVDWTGPGREVRRKSPTGLLNGPGSGPAIPERLILTRANRHVRLPVHKLGIRPMGEVDTIATVHTRRSRCTVNIGHVS